MKISTTTLLLVIAGACFPKKGEIPEGFEEGTDRIPPGLSCDQNSKIVGGEVANVGTWPWLVQLEMLDHEGNKWMCAGTILSDTRVLSAAHCFVGDKTTVKVHVGNWKSSKQEEGEFTLMATDIDIHSGFGLVENAYDLAMISIPSLNENKPESCNGCFDRACLPTEHAEHGRACWAGGWGTTRLGGRVSNKQKEVGVHIMSADYCRNISKYEDQKIVVAQEFCAGKPDMDADGVSDGGDSVCHGDSGGPLICNDGGKPIVYGIVSWGEGCAWDGYPAIYVKVASQLSWITKRL